MPTPDSDHHRLQVLNESTPTRSWNSIAERRQCIVCDHTFSGSEVIVRRNRRSPAQLKCPLCGSAPEQWARPGNPFLDDQIWAEWEVAIASAERDGEDDDELATVG